MEILLAVGAALAYGISDFGGGVLSKRAHVLTVLLLAQLIGFVALVVVVLGLGDAFSWPGVAWGAVAGVAGVVGTGLLYQGLATGRMSIIAPLAGVLSAGLPALFGLLVGEQPSVLALLGMGLGLVAVVVITRTSEPSAAGSSRAAVLYGLGAGVGFAAFFILLQRSPADSGLWPTVGARVSLLALVAVIVLVGRVTVRPPQGTIPLLVGLGLVNLAADLLFLVATREGMLSIVAVITSLYPAVTVALAAVVLRERVTRGQLVGLLAAGVAVGLIAAR